MTHVAAVELQHIEGEEMRPVATEQQPIEIWPAIRIEAADFTIKTGGADLHGAWALSRKPAA